MLSPIYEKRQVRAEKLAQRPAAKEILAFYVELLKLQEPVYRKTLSSDWLAAVQGDVSDGPPYLRLDHVPVGDLVPDFGLFLRDSASKSLRVQESQSLRISESHSPES